MRHHPNFSRDFSVAIRRALSVRGIAIVGVQAIPVNGSCLDSERGYMLDDNGTRRIRVYGEVIDLANEQ